jgi:chromosome segregation ATPase
LIFSPDWKVKCTYWDASPTLQRLLQYTEQLDIIIQSEREKVQRDLKEANHLIKAKDELIIQLKDKVSQLESQCQAKDRVGNSLALKLKNQEDLIALFEKNYNSLRAQISDLQLKFEKEKFYG